MHYSCQNSQTILMFTHIYTEWLACSAHSRNTAWYAAEPDSRVTSTQSYPLPDIHSSSLKLGTSSVWDLVDLAGLKLIRVTQ